MSHARKEYRDFMTLAPEAYEVVLALGKVAAAAGIGVFLYAYVLSDEEFGERRQL